MELWTRMDVEMAQLKSGFVPENVSAAICLWLDKGVPYDSVDFFPFARAFVLFKEVP